MSARFIIRRSGQALWSQRVALFAAQLLLLTALLHRFESIETPVAVMLLSVGIGIALVAVLLGLGALYQIWHHGLEGTGRALAGLLIAALILAVPAWYVPDLVTKPRLIDISTSVEGPSPFQAALVARGGGSANRIESYDPELAELQEAAYPDIRPMTLEKSPREAFQLAHVAVEQLGWQILAAQAPERGQPGRIEAVAKTLIMGFADDVVIQVSADKDEARIDVRSTSRHGERDFGANAGHIRRLFAQIEASLEAGERQALEIALAKRAEALRLAREVRLAKERKLREEQEAREREELLRAMRERTQIAEPQAPPQESNTAASNAQRGQKRSARRPRRQPAGLGNFWQQLFGPGRR